MFVFVSVDSDDGGAARPVFHGRVGASLGALILRAAENLLFAHFKFLEGH